MWKIVKIGVSALFIVAAPIGAWVAVQYNEPSKQEAVQEANNQSEIKAVDILSSERVAYYTKVLAIFTAVLSAFGLLQIFFLIRADKNAKSAADAASLSARAAIAIELPIIRAEPSDFRWNLPKKVDDQVRHSFNINGIYFSNLGRTKAFPIEVRFGYSAGDELPATPVYSFTKDFSVSVVLEAEPLLKVLREIDFEVPPDLFDKLRASSAKLWIYCNLIYLDFMQKRHEAAFCWERFQRPGSGVFRDDPTPAYNKKT